MSRALAKDLFEDFPIFRNLMSQSVALGYRNFRNRRGPIDLKNPSRIWFKKKGFLKNLYRGISKSVFRKNLKQISRTVGSKSAGLCGAYGCLRRGRIWRIFENFAPPPCGELLRWCNNESPISGRGALIVALQSPLGALWESSPPGGEGAVPVGGD